MFTAIYRLDRLTSGVLILGKTREYTKVLEDLIIERGMEKTYVCRVMGEFPEWVFIFFFYLFTFFFLFPLHVSTAIHRLDRLTSGVLLLGKKRDYIAVIKDLMLVRAVEKSYVCRVVGKFPEWVAVWLFWDRRISTDIMEI